MWVALNLLRPTGGLEGAKHIPWLAGEIIISNWIIMLPTSPFSRYAGRRGTARGDEYWAPVAVRLSAHTHKHQQNHCHIFYASPLLLGLNWFWNWLWYFILALQWELGCKMLCHVTVSLNPGLKEPFCFKTLLLQYSITVISISSNVLCFWRITEIVILKMKVLSPFTHPHIYANLYEFLY